MSLNGRVEKLVQTSEVQFKTLSDAEIRAYIATQEPMDKAGAYGIQKLGGCFVVLINGSFTGVMGLPIYETAEMLKQFDVQIFA